MKPMKLRLMGLSINHLLTALSASAALAVTSALAVTDTWIAAGGAGGSGNWDTTSLNWNDGVTAGVAFADGNDVVFDNNAGGTITVVGTVSPASTLFSATTGNYTLPAGGIVAGTGPLTKSGAGELQIKNVNSFTGKTTVNAGTLRLTNSGGLSNAGVNGPLGAPVGANATIDLLNGSTFQTGGVEPRLNQSTDRPLNLAGTGAGTVFLRVNDNDTRFTFGSVTASGTGAKTLALFMGNSGNGDRESLIFNGGISDSSDAPTSLTISFNTGNSAHLSLVGTNTFTGSISTVNANPGLNSVSTLTVGGLFTGPNAANGLATVNVRGTGSLGAGNYAGNISLGLKTVLNYRSSVAQTLAGVISGAGAVTVDGLSTVTMTGLNTYTGNTTVPTGNTLVLTDAGGMTFAVTNASANKITGTGAATLDGTFNIDTSAVINTTGTWTLVDTSSKSFGGTFAVAGFTQAADVWSRVDGSKTWTFTEGDGVLSLTSTAVFTSFGIPGYPGVIDNNALTIRLVVPKDTNLATLAPTYTVASGTVNQPNDGTTPPSPTFAAANPVTYTLTSGATVKNYAVTAVPATGIINLAVHHPDDVVNVTSANLFGPNGVAAGVETWNLATNAGVATLASVSGLLDSVGFTTDVGVSFSGIGGPDDWGYNSPLKLLWRSGRAFSNDTYANSAGSFSITGLTPGATFDLWIASSHVGSATVGDWTTGNANSTGASVVLDNTGSPSNGSTWMSGVNYVLFEDIVANGSGNITMTSHLTTFNGSRVGFNGFQLIPVAAPIGTDYDTWMDGFPSITGADRLSTADPDGDGLTNQQEYAFGLNPTLGSSVNPITVPLDKTTGTFTYTRRATPAITGLAYTVLTSTDLVTWTPDGGSESIATAGEVQTVTFTVTNPAVDGKLFVRVKAQ